MKKRLSMKEILQYGFLISVFVFSIVYLITLQEEAVETEYHHEIQDDISVTDPDSIRIGVLAMQGEDTALSQ